MPLSSLCTDMFELWVTEVGVLWGWSNTRYTKRWSSTKKHDKETFFWWVLSLAIVNGIFHAQGLESRTCLAGLRSSPIVETNWMSILLRQKNNEKRGWRWGWQQPLRNKIRKVTRSAKVTRAAKTTEKKKQKHSKNKKKHYIGETTASVHPKNTFFSATPVNELACLPHGTTNSSYLTHINNSPNCEHWVTPTPKAQSWTRPRCVWPRGGWGLRIGVVIEKHVRVC